MIVDCVTGRHGVKLSSLCHRNGERQCAQFIRLNFLLFLFEIVSRRKAKTSTIYDRKVRKWEQKNSPNRPTWFVKTQNIRFFYCISLYFHHSMMEIWFIFVIISRVIFPLVHSLFVSASATSERVKCKYKKCCLQQIVHCYVNNSWAGLTLRYDTRWCWWWWRRWRIKITEVIVIAWVEQLTSHRVMFIKKRDLRGKGFMPITADASEANRANPKIKFRHKTRNWFARFFNSSYKLPARFSVI